MQHGALHLREARQAVSLLPPSANDPNQTDDPINSAQQQNQPSFYPLTTSDISVLNDELSSDTLQCKKDWFTFNGGQLTTDTTTDTTTDNKTHKKPLFFDIALNYVQLDMERLQERAGKPPTSSSGAENAIEAPRGTGARAGSGSVSAANVRNQNKSDLRPPETTAGAASEALGVGRKAGNSSSLVGKTAKVKVEAAERERVPTPEPGSQAARGGLGGLLGGWWGRK